VELSDYVRVLRKNWLLIAAAILAGLLAAAGYAFTRTPVYESTSELYVSSGAGSTIVEQQQGNVYTQARVQSYVQLAITPKVLGPVVDELGLGVTSSELADAVKVTSPVNTTVLRITVRETDAQRAATIANTIADSLTRVIDEVETLPATGVSPVKVTFVTAAEASSSPVSPNIPVMLALGALIGLAAGLSVTVLRAALDTRIRASRDLLAITDVPVIGSIPFDARAGERPIVLRSDPRHERSEAFRTLRTNLQFLDIEEAAHSFVITSAMPNEGKSTTAVNLAIALADAGQRVVLVDADLRSPSVARYLGIEGGAGLTDVLIGRADVADVVQPWSDRSLYVLPAGRIPPNPSELLGSRQMADLLGVLAAEADVVLLDAPPLLPVTDAALIAKIASGGAIVVVSTREARRPMLERALHKLELVDAHVAGVVLSMVSTRGADAREYGYGYGYAQDVARTASHPRVRPRRRR